MESFIKKRAEHSLSSGYSLYLHLPPCAPLSHPSIISIMSVPAGQRPLDKYVRFYDMTGLKKIRDGSQLSFFDFAPAKAHLELGRGVDQKDNLPPLEELLDEKDAAYVSGQANFKKYCHNKVISRKHASIRWQPTQLYPILFDESSRHGTFIMHLGSELSFSDVPNLDEDDPKWIKVEKNGSVTLKDGDVIQLGRKVTVDGKKTDPFRLLVSGFRMKISRHLTDLCFLHRSRSISLIRASRRTDSRWWRSSRMMRRM
jgi:hypothetical protein